MRGFGAPRPGEGVASGRGRAPDSMRRGTRCVRSAPSAPCELSLAVGFCGTMRLRPPGRSERDSGQIEVRSPRDHPRFYGERASRRWMRPGGTSRRCAAPDRPPPNKQDAGEDLVVALPRNPDLRPGRSPSPTTTICRAGRRRASGVRSRTPTSADCRWPTTRRRRPGLHRRAGPHVQGPHPPVRDVHVPDDRARQRLRRRPVPARSAVHELLRRPPRLPARPVAAGRQFSSLWRRRARVRRERPRRPGGERAQHLRAGSERPVRRLRQVGEHPAVPAGGGDDGGLADEIAAAVLGPPAALERRPARSGRTRRTRRPTAGRIRRPASGRARSPCPAWTAGSRAASAR